MKNTLLLLGFILLIILAYYVGSLQSGKLGAAIAINNYDTTNSGFTYTTSTINTTSTQVASSITRLLYLTNNVATDLVTCSLDAKGTTAVSSTVIAGRGVLIYPSSTIAIGECRDQKDCYPHKGAVNCLRTAANPLIIGIQ